MLKEETEKRKRMEGVVKNHISKEEEKLQQKIQLRQSRASATKKLRNSLQSSCQSTLGETESENFRFSFSEIPFIEE